MRGMLDSNRGQTQPHSGALNTNMLNPIYTVHTVTNFTQINTAHHFFQVNVCKYNLGFHYVNILGRCHRECTLVMCCVLSTQWQWPTAHNQIRRSGPQRTTKFAAVAHSAQPNSP
jgi:hypothetical protein